MIAFLIITAVYFSWFASGQEAQYQNYKQQLKKVENEQRSN